MYKVLSEEEKKARKVARQQERKAAKELARIESEKNQKPVKKMTINIEWHKSRTWGYCPRAHAQIEYHDGSYLRTEDSYYASGYGYDKESTVIAEIFNDFMKYKLWNIGPDKIKGGNGSGDNGSAPYGIHIYSDSRPHFGGGIGTNCYYRIAEYIGGKFNLIASGRTFDVYEYTDNE